MDKHENKQTVLNPLDNQNTQVPTTPKKKPKYAIEQQTSSRRIKSITKVVQKESVSLVYSLLVLIWTVAAGFVLYMAFQTKLKSAQADAHRDIETCRLDYENNRCFSPIPGLVGYCSQKLTCMNETSLERTGKSVSYSRLLGQIASEFAQGAGLLGILLGVLLIGLCLRQKGREKSILMMQYFEDR